MEDPEKSLDEAATGKHTVRTPEDFADMVRNLCEQEAGGELDEERYRNAGDIVVLEHAMSIEVLVPLPYFHHTGITEEAIESLLSRLTPGTVAVDVRVRPPGNEEI